MNQRKGVSLNKADYENSQPLDDNGSQTKDTMEVGVESEEPLLSDTVVRLTAEEMDTLWLVLILLIPFVMLGIKEKIVDRVRLKEFSNQIILFWFYTGIFLVVTGALRLMLAMYGVFTFIGTLISDTPPYIKVAGVVMGCLNLVSLVFYSVMLAVYIKWFIMAIAGESLKKKYFYGFTVFK